MDRYSNALCASVVSLAMLVAGCYGPTRFTKTDQRLEVASKRVLRVHNHALSLTIVDDAIEVRAVDRPVCREARYGDAIEIKHGERWANRIPGLTVGIIGVVAGASFLIGPLFDEDRDERAPTTAEYVFAGVGGGVGLAGFLVALLTPKHKAVTVQRKAGKGAEWGAEAAPCKEPARPLTTGSIVLSVSLAGPGSSWADPLTARVMKLQATLDAQGRARFSRADLAYLAVECGANVALAATLVDTGAELSDPEWPERPSVADLSTPTWPAEAALGTLKRPPAASRPSKLSPAAQRVLDACMDARAEADATFAANHPEAGDGAIYAWVTHRDYADNQAPSGPPNAIDRGHIQYLFRSGSPTLTNPTNYDVRTTLEGQLGRHLARHLPARAQGPPRPLVVLGSYAFVRQWRNEELRRCVAPCRLTRTDNMGFVPGLDRPLKALVRRAKKEKVEPPALPAPERERVEALAKRACGCGAARASSGACPPAFEPAAMRKACGLRARKPVACQCPD